MSIIFTSCKEYEYVDENSFVGVWKLKGRALYEEMTIKIEKENGHLKGTVLSPPHNAYADLFMKEKDLWIPEIKRGADYYFKLEELKIASQLFAVYGLPGSTQFFATFSTDKNRIYLSTQKSSTVKESGIYYQRVE